MVIFSADNISVDTEVLLIPILSSKYHHPIDSRLSVLGVSCRNGDLYVLPICHDEGNQKFPILLSRKAWSSDKKLFSYVSNDDTDDATSIEYILNNQIEDISKFYTITHCYYYQQYPHSNIVNEIIPLVKHAEMLEAYSSHLWSFIDRRNEIPKSALQFLSNITIPTLFSIEKNGFAIDEDKFEEFFKRRYHKSIIHSQYNPYTTTGRCTNKFDGVNFAALNKSDGSRSAFISRFGKKGSLVNIDFESFHLRLIADLMKYDLPNESLHNFFGRQYFRKNTLTEDEYEESKRRSFTLLYGNSLRSDTPEFFQKVHTYSDTLVSELETIGYVASSYTEKPIFKRNVHDSKVIFNYIMQLAETEMNLESISKIISLLDLHQSKPILYLYDSLLIDMLNEEKEVLLEIIRILEKGGKFPVKVSVGPNFHEMRKIK